MMMVMMLIVLISIVPLALVLKPSRNLSLLFNQFNNFSPEEKLSLKMLLNCNDIDQFQFLKFHEKGHYPYFI